MQINLRMSLDNEAFEECRPEETARILRKLADYIEGYWCDFRYNEGMTLMDINGNRVGAAQLLEGGE